MVENPFVEPIYAKTFYATGYKGNAYDGAVIAESIDGIDTTHRINRQCPYIQGSKQDGPTAVGILYSTTEEATETEIGIWLTNCPTCPAPIKSSCFGAQKAIQIAGEDKLPANREEVIEKHGQYSK